MFFSSPSADLQVIMVLIGFSFVVSVVTYLMSKKILASIFLFSLLGNIIINGNIDYNFANMFDIIWLFNFNRYVWPYINLLLFLIIIFNYFKNKNEKVKKK